MKLFVLVCGVAALACGGCVSLAERAGQALDGSAFAEKSVAVYRAAGVEEVATTGSAAKKAGAKGAKDAAGMKIQEVENKAGERSVVISLGRFPEMKIRGSAPDGDGEFFLRSLDYLGGSVQGWNEFRLDLSGSGRLSLGEASAVLSIPGEIEAVQISSGRIRRYDTRITGTEALTNLRNRRERILSLAEWMNSRDDAPQGLAPEAFDAYWKPLLFPEITPKKKQPEGWAQDGDEWVKAEDIRWNSGYTERAFSEILRPIRDSGTMLRDWEEAFGWIYMECEWERIAGLLSRETVLERTKK